MKKHYYLIAATMLLLASCSNEKSDWQNAKTQDNIQAYEQFLQKYPQSVLKDSANFMIKEIKNPTGVVVSLPLVSFSMNDMMSGQIKKLNFDGNICKVKLTVGKAIEATATQEQLEIIAAGKKNVQLKKNEDNKWTIVKIVE